jgi:hypothetical protein
MASLCRYRRRIFSNLLFYIVLIAFSMRETLTTLEWVKDVAGDPA